MAAQAKCAHVRQVALPTAFRDGNNVIGVPHRFTAAFFKLPVFEKLAPRREIEFAHFLAELRSVCAADCADTLVTFEDLLAKIPWVSAKLPLMHAGIGTKRSPAFTDFVVTPSAERPSGSAVLNFRGLHPAARFLARE